MPTGTPSSLTKRSAARTQKRFCETKPSEVLAAPSWLAPRRPFRHQCKNVISPGFHETESPMNNRKSMFRKQLSLKTPPRNSAQLAPTSALYAPRPPVSGAHLPIPPAGSSSLGHRSWAPSTWLKEERPREGPRLTIRCLGRDSLDRRADRPSVASQQHDQPNRENQARREGEH